MSFPPHTLRHSANKSPRPVRNLDKAYTAAVKEYLILKLDVAAGVIEKEQREFHFSSALLFGKRSYLVTLTHFDLKIVNPTGFSTNGTDALSGQKLKQDGEEIPHSIFFAPPPNDFSEVSYPLGGKWSVFRVTVGVPKIEDNARREPRHRSDL